MLQNCSTNNGGVQKVSGANETNASYNSWGPKNNYQNVPPQKENTNASLYIF